MNKDKNICICYCGESPATETAIDFEGKSQKMCIECARFCNIAKTKKPLDDEKSTTDDTTQAETCSRCNADSTGGLIIGSGPLCIRCCQWAATRVATTLGPLDTI